MLSITTVLYFRTPLPHEFTSVQSNIIISLVTAVTRESVFSPKLTETRFERELLGIERIRRRLPRIPRRDHTDKYNGETRQIPAECVIRE